MPFAERQPMSPYLPPAKPTVAAAVSTGGGRGPTVWHCLHCGKKNLSISRFCGGCGVPTAIPPEAVEQMQKRQQPVSHTLRGGQAVASPVANPGTSQSSVVPTVATFVTVTEPVMATRPVVPEREEAVPVKAAAPAAPAATATEKRPESQAPIAPIEAPTPVAGAIAGMTWLARIRIILKAASSKIAVPVLGAADVCAWLMSRLRQDQNARRSVAIGATLAVMVMFGLWPLLAVSSGKWNGGREEPAKPVFWSDLQSFLSRQLGVSLADTEVLARAAWGEVPSSRTPMTCERAQGLEAVVNKTGDRPLVLFPNIPFRGPLLERHLASDAAEPGPFADVPLDHPLYEAWRALLALRPLPPITLSGNRAAPYESLRWEEWQPLVASVWRVCRPGKEPPAELLLDRSGVIAGVELDRSLSVLGGGLGIEIGQTPFRAIPPITPSRMEAFAALSGILAASLSQGGG